jgi:hypothetical protein
MMPHDVGWRSGALLWPLAAPSERTVVAHLHQLRRPIDGDQLAVQVRRATQSLGRPRSASSEMATAPGQAAWSSGNEALQTG